MTNTKLPLKEILKEVEPNTVTQTDTVLGICYLFPSKDIWHLSGEKQLLDLFFSHATEREDLTPCFIQICDIQSYAPTLNASSEFSERLSSHVPLEPPCPHHFLMFDSVYQICRVEKIVVKGSLGTWRNNIQVRTTKSFFGVAISPFFLWDVGPESVIRLVEIIFTKKASLIHFEYE